MKRRSAREYTLQMLFQYDFTHRKAHEIIDDFWKDKNVDDAVRQFANDIFKGAIENLKQIDGIIIETTEHWVIERMAIVDRNILRFACFELLHRNDIPPLVSINEAIEIAKKYSSQEASSFINGILDKVARNHLKVHN